MQRRRRASALPLPAALGGAAAVAFAALLLGGCTPPVQMRGYQIDPETVSAIQPGRDTRDSVRQLLGSPSTISTFTDSSWYYIGERSEQYAFYAREVLDRDILVVRFDDRGVVSATERLDLSKAQEIDPVDRVTPTEGRNLTVVQQFFGNIGRFNNAQDSFRTPGRPRTDY